MEVFVESTPLFSEKTKSRAGEAFGVDVYLEGAPDLRGYQLVERCRRVVRSSGHGSRHDSAGLARAGHRRAVGC